MEDGQTRGDNGSLPYRQLRNQKGIAVSLTQCSLPYRQLRKVIPLQPGIEMMFTAVQAA